MTRRWTITTHVTGKPRAVDVFLYTDLNHLRGAATRHSRWSGEGGGMFGDAVGICHGFTRGRDVDGEWDEDETVAIIRLAETHLTPLIVSHEVAHAAQHIYGLDYADDRHISEHMHSGNEEFAHIAGELLAATWGIFGNRFMEQMA